MSEEKAYTLRELRADDIFLTVRVINKIGLDRLKKCMEAQGVKAAMEIMTNNEADTPAKEAAMNRIGLAVMLEIAGAVLERLPDCRNEIYTLLAVLSGTSEEYIGRLPSGVFMSMVMDVIKKDEWKDFFQVAFGSFS